METLLFNLNTSQLKDLNYTIPLRMNIYYIKENLIEQIIKKIRQILVLI